jgi:hypothetical protein
MVQAAPKAAFEREVRMAQPWPPEQLPVRTAPDAGRQTRALAKRIEPKAGDESVSEANARVNRGKRRSVEAE